MESGLHHEVLENSLLLKRKEVDEYIILTYTRDFRVKLSEVGILITLMLLLICIILQNTDI